MKTKFIALLLPLISLMGCGSNQSEKPVLYTSFYPVYDFVSRIVGDLYVVKNLTPPGAEPHDYEITNRDMVGMTESKAIFLNGIGLEHWASSLPGSLSKKTYVITKNVPLEQVDGIDDPHVWLNPQNAIIELGNILSFMKEIDPDHSSIFEQNHRNSVSLFENLDEKIANKRKSFGNDYFAVSHAAFGYLASRYDLTQIYVSGISPSQEPLAKDMEAIAEKIKEHNINTIFTEELVSPEIAEAIARETGAKLDVLNPLEGLSEEQLSKGAAYVSVMEDNLDRLYKASL